MDYDSKQTTVAARLGMRSLLAPALATYALSGIGVGLSIWYHTRNPGIVFTLLGLASLYVIHDELFARCFGQQATSQVFFAGGCAIYGVGSIAIAIAAVTGTATVTLAGTWGAALGLASVVAGARLLTSDPSGATWRWVVGGFGIAGMCLVAAVLVIGHDEFLALSLLLGLLATTVGVIAMRWMCRRDPRVWASVGLAIAATGFVCIGISFWLPVEPLVWLALFFILLALGLVPLSFAAPTLTQSWTTFGLPVAAAVGLAVGAFLIVALDGDLSSTALVVVLLISTLISVAFVWEGFEMVPIIVLGIAISWVVADRSDAVPEPTAAVEVQAAGEPGETLIAIGDSYMSGEGATRYIAGTNIKNANECRRTLTAYPQLIAEGNDWDLEFYACSGAIAANVLTTGQQARSPDDVSQIERLDAFLSGAPGGSDDIAAVLISIGGNDAWFSAIAQACVAPGNCAEHRSTALRNVRLIGDRMRAVYEEVRMRVHPAPVVAMAYPLVFADQTCDASPVSDEELAFLIEFTEVLNDRARTSASQAGINFFEPGEEIFVPLRICDTESLSDAVVNLSLINPQEGNLAERLNPLNWLHGSAHPKPEGHRIIAERLSDWLADIDSNPDPEPAARFDILLRSPLKRVSTRTLGIPEDLPCGQGRLPVSAVSMGLAADEVSWTYPSARPASPVCFTQADGTWSSDQIVATEDGTIVVPALIPDEGWTQVVIYQTALESWNVRVLEMCEPNPDCAHDRAAVDSWTVKEIRTKVEAAAAPILLIFLGVWSMTVATKRAFLNRSS